MTSSDPFSAQRDHLHAALNDAIAGLDYSHSQLLGLRAAALSGPDGDSALLPALLALQTAESLGADSKAALTIGVSLALLESSAHVINDLTDSTKAEHSLAPAWGEPRTLNAADGFFALGHETLLSLQDQGVATAQVLELADGLILGIRAWSDESEARFSAGQTSTAQPSPALLRTAVVLGAQVAGQSAAIAGTLADAVVANDPAAIAGTSINPSAAEALVGAAAYLAGVEKQ